MKKVRFFSLILALIVLSTFSACVSNSSSDDAYFPIVEGKTITYDIEIKSSTLYYYLTEWSKTSGQTLSYSTRGYILSTINCDTDGAKDGVLSLKVIGSVPTPDYLDSGKTYELEIVEDSLGIYTDVDKLYWFINEYSEVSEVLYFGPDSSLAPAGSIYEMPSVNYGYSKRTLQFPVNKILAIPDGYDQRTENIGYENIKGTKTIHMQRQVYANEIEGSRVADKMDMAFTEDAWYSPGVGLVKLIQTVDDQQTMVWEIRK